jgi:DNA-binding GntR family transcriptional regulator
MAAGGQADAARMHSTVHDHQVIADAIGAGDAVLAGRLTRMHLAHADRALRGDPVDVGPDESAHPLLTTATA